MPHATVFPDISGKKAGAAPLTRLLAAIEAGKPLRASKSACPLFSAFTFGSERTQRGSLRSTDNARSAWAVVAEHDAGTVAPELARDKLVALGIRATLYTTPSHTPEAPRWRIVAPTARELEKAQYPRMVARLNGLFGGAIARESFTVAQSFYFGRVNGRPFEAFAIEGAPLDALDELDAGAIYPSGASATEMADGPASSITDAEHRDTIHTGADGVQRALLALAARWIARGIPPDDVSSVLLELLDACVWKCRDSNRWRARRDSVVRCVTTASAKFADKRGRNAEEQEIARRSGPQRDSIVADGMQYEPNPTDPPPVDLLRPMTAPPLRTADVPEVLAQFSDAHARATGFDVSIMLTGGIVAAAAMLTDEVRLCVSARSSWFESARLWSVVIGGPGAGKSPALKAAQAPLFALHRDLIGEWTSAHGTEENPPPRPCIYTSDATTEALAEVLRDNPRGILYTVDELHSWLESHDAYRNSGGKDRGEWLRLYDGGPHQVNRIKRGAFFVQNWGASLLSATTPAALRKLAPKLPDDGLLQRLLLVVVRARELPDDAMLRVETAGPTEAWCAALGRLYALPSAVVHLSGDARAVFAKEEADLHHLTQAYEDAHPSYSAHMAKRAAMVARLALVFHALEAPAITDNVTGDTMRRAVRFLRRQERHAMAVYGTMLGAGTGMALAQAVARSILASNLQSFNRRELTPRCKAFRHADELSRAAALTLLCDYGWLTTATGTITHGAQWTVDQRVHSLFAEHGKIARLRREAIRARLTGSDDDQIDDSDKP